jgi:hypothetical protein
MVRYYPGICWDGLRRIMKNLKIVKPVSIQGFNPGPSEYKAGVLTTQPHCSVTRYLTRSAAYYLYFPSICMVYIVTLRRTWQ